MNTLSASPNYRIVTGDDAQINLMTMLLSQRVDYTIDYEMIKRYYDTTHQPSSREQLVFLLIKEYEGQSIEGAIGCSNNDWGQQAAASLNSAINKLQSSERFQQALDVWLGKNRPK